MAKKGIIFDMDGTLWDSSVQVAQAWTEAMAKAGHPEIVITVDDMQRVMGKTMDLIAEILLPGMSDRERTVLLDLCCKEENVYLREHGAVLYDALAETMRELKKDYHLYIVSNCQAGYIEAFLDHYGFWDLFEDIECYGNNGRPKGENIRLLADRNALTDAVYVGDIQGDCDSADSAGVGFIHASYGFGTIDHSVPLIRALKELPKVVPGVL